MCLLKVGLEAFLKKHRTEALPDWFKTFEWNGKFSSENGQYVLVAQDDDTYKWEENGLTPVPYIPDKVAYTEAKQDYSISSRFSGCFMAVFKFKSDLSGKRYVCHIATGGKVKRTLLEDFRADQNIEIIVEFKPSDINGILVKRYGKEIGSEINLSTAVFGVITKENECYSIVVRRDPEENTLFVFDWVKWPITEQEQTPFSDTSCCAIF